MKYAMLFANGDGDEIEYDGNCLIMEERNDDSSETTAVYMTRGELFRFGLRCILHAIKG